MGLTPQDVRDKAFSPTRFRLGYNEDEVDEFLDLVEAELIRLNSECEDLRAKLAAAQATRITAAEPVEETSTRSENDSVVPVTPDDDVLRRTLVTAQKTADDVVSQARDQAAQLIAEAMDRAVQLERQANEQYQTTMNRLTGEQSRLESVIEQLRAFEREYRTRLKAYLEMQLRDLVAGTAPVDSEDSSSIRSVDGQELQSSGPTSPAWSAKPTAAAVEADPA